MSIILKIIRKLNPITVLLFKPSSHYAKFCLFGKLIYRQKAISSANYFFHPPKFSQMSPNFKDAVECFVRRQSAKRGRAEPHC